MGRSYPRADAVGVGRGEDCGRQSYAPRHAAAKALDGRALADLLADPPHEIAEYLKLCSESREPLPRLLTLRSEARGQPTHRCEGAVLDPQVEPSRRLILLRLTPCQPSGPFAALDRPVQDLSEEIARRRASEEQLRRQLNEAGRAEARTRSVMDHILDGIVTIDEQGRIQTFNPAAQRIFGYAAEEVIGQNVKILIPPPFADEHDEYLAALPPHGAGTDHRRGTRSVAQRKDGSVFPMDLGVTEFQFGAQRYFTGIVRDVSESKRREHIARFLADASRSLATLVDYQSTMQKIARLAVPFFADWCVVHLAHPTGGLHALAVAHRDPALYELAQTLAERYPLLSGKPLSTQRVFETGQATLIEEIKEEELAAMAEDDQHAAILRSSIPDPIWACRWKCGAGCWA